MSLVTFVWREVTLTEGAARSGLQVPFEAPCITFGHELHRDHERPRSVLTRASGRSVVMPLQASTNVRCDTGVKAEWIDVTADDVDNALLGLHF